MFLCTRKTFRCTFMRLNVSQYHILRRSRRASPAGVSNAHSCVSNVSQLGYPPPESPRIPPPESQLHIYASQMCLNRAFLRRSRRASPRRSLKCTFMRLKCVSIGLSSAGVAAHPLAGVSMCLNWAILRRSRRASPLRIYLRITHY